MNFYSAGVIHASPFLCLLSLLSRHIQCYNSLFPYNLGGAATGLATNFLALLFFFFIFLSSFSCPSFPAQCFPRTWYGLFLYSDKVNFAAGGSFYFSTFVEQIWPWCYRGNRTPQMFSKAVRTWRSNFKTSNCSYPIFKAMRIFPMKPFQCFKDTENTQIIHHKRFSLSWYIL